MKKYYLVADFDHFDLTRNGGGFRKLPVFADKGKAKKYVGWNYSHLKPAARPEIITVTRSQPPRPVRGN